MIKYPNLFQNKEEIANSMIHRVSLSLIRCKNINK